MANKLTPHITILAAIICLLVFGITTDRPEIGTAIGAAIGLTLQPISIVTAIVLGLWFVPYRSFLLAVGAAVVVLQLLASLTQAPHPAITQLNLTPNEAMFLRAAGFVCLAHLSNAARLFFSHKA
ncbi:hypothetical protein AOB54_07980 [beta proteobacterium MWH-UniP1]